MRLADVTVGCSETGSLRHLDAAAGDTSEPTLALLDRLTEQGYQIDELLGDRGFSYKRPEDWSTKLHERNISQVQEIHPFDYGVKDYEGIRVIDGLPYCASLPDELVHIVRPQRFKVGPLKKRASAEEKLNHERNTKDLERLQAQIAERQQYAFVFNQNTPRAHDPFKTQ